MKKITLLLSIFFTATTVFAASGSSFLKIPVGARAVGLGNAYTALADDATALHWNPAGLSRLGKREVSAMHAELIADTRYDYLGYAHPTKNGTWGMSAVYLSQGNIEGRAEDRRQTADFTASDMAVTMGAGRRVNGQTSAGAALKLIQSKIAEQSATGVALDLGLQRTLNRATLGLAIQNVGPQMKFAQEGYNLPLTFAAGISYPVLKSLTIAGDLKHQPYESKTTLSMGVEFTPVSMLTLRGGYLGHMGPRANAAQTQRGSSASDKISNMTGLGLGFGFRARALRLDYALTPMGELGPAQRLTLSIKF